MITNRMMKADKIRSQNNLSNMLLRKNWRKESTICIYKINQMRRLMKIH